MEEKDERPVTVPYWALSEAVPTMMGVRDLFSIVHEVGITSPSDMDMERFEAAILALFDAMEHTDAHEGTSGE